MSKFIMTTGDITSFVVCVLVQRVGCSWVAWLGWPRNDNVTSIFFFFSSFRNGTATAGPTETYAWWENSTRKDTHDA